MLKITFLEFVKLIVFGIKQANKKPNPENALKALKDELNEEDYVSVGSIDETSEASEAPVGVCPKECPQPSKISAVLFYLSIVVTMIGSTSVLLLFLVKV